MKKTMAYKIICVILCVIMVLAVVGIITVTGSGFLDLSNIVRAICTGVAIICAILAWIFYRNSKC